jgi:hypothetical protein
MRLTNHKKNHRDRRSGSKVIDENVARKNRLQLFARYCIRGKTVDAQIHQQTRLLEALTHKQTIMLDAKTQKDARFSDAQNVKMDTLKKHSGKYPFKTFICTNLLQNATLTTRTLIAIHCLKLHFHLNLIQIKQPLKLSTKLFIQMLTELST